ncbi:rac GTPase-activating protein 1 isoform 2-T2 [Menidia menidia]
MQLMCDVLAADSRCSSVLNAEQKSLLAAFEQRGANANPNNTQRSSRRLAVIDESSFLSHSDISYDRTDDEVTLPIVQDLDSTAIKPLRSRTRERRRSSMGPLGGNPLGRKSRGGNLSAELLERRTVEKEVETVVKASVTTPDSGRIRLVLGITQDSPEDPTRAPDRTQEAAAELTSVWFPCDDTVVEPEAPPPPAPPPPHSSAQSLRHVFLSKTVIRPETCGPCGKRIRFGKMALKCKHCRVAAHPECKQKFPNGCPAPAAGGPGHMDSLEDFAPLTHPRVPQLVVDCVAEIERRGLQERGLYRIPGGERPVKELRERFLLGKPSVVLSKVQDIHVVCGVLKDFLRRLREPLITFRLHRTFMEAAELTEDGGAAILDRAIAELPKANRDTLAFLMLHLHKVKRSSQCQMDQKNLARVFGPTIVGHGMPEPSPTTIMRDTSIQPKVICKLLSIPEDYWRQILSIPLDQIPPASKKTGQDQGYGRLFEPLTSPELNSFQKNPSCGSIRGRIRNQYAGIGRTEPGRKFFASPT